jgi:hypothetical protein
MQYGRVYAIRLKYYTFCVQEEQKPCISTLPQLDFSATMAALLGVAIPFGRSGIC